MHVKRCSLRKIFLVLLSWIALLFLSIGFIYLFIQHEREDPQLILLVPHCVLICFLSLCFIRASLMDPGYLPFGFPHEYDKEIEPKGFKPPMVKDVIINSINTKLKWCLTCKIYRYPRVSHCSICQRCVEIFDHHCPWINNCVGKRNYRCFIMFLLSTVIHGYTSVIRSIIIIIESRTNISEFLPIFAIVLVCLTLIFLIPLTGLTCFHLFLISNSRTTNEHVTSKFISGLNPYDKGCGKNLLGFLCRTEYPRTHYDPRKAIKTYQKFFRVNEKLGEQKKAVINELRCKLKKPNTQLNGEVKSKPNGESQDRKPIAPPPYNSNSKKVEKNNPPVPPPHGSIRFSNTSNSIMNITCNSISNQNQPIVIPPSVPPHRSLSNFPSENSSANWSTTPIYLHNVSPNEITKNKDDLVNASCPNMEEWSRQKKIPSANNSFSLIHEKEVLISPSKTIIQRPSLSFNKPHLPLKDDMGLLNEVISTSNIKKDLSSSILSVNQRNRLISSGRLAQYENQSPPPEGTVEISI